MRKFISTSVCTAAILLFLGCSGQDQSVQPVVSAFVPPAGKTMAHPTVPDCWHALGGTCCDIKGDTIVTLGVSFSYRYIHNQTKIDSIGWNFETKDTTSFNLHTSDSVAVLTFLSNFSSGRLRVYAKGAGWACEDGLGIHK